MTDEKTTPGTPDERATGIDDLGDTVVREPARPVEEAPVSETETQAYDFRTDAAEAPVASDTVDSTAVYEDPAPRTEAAALTESEPVAGTDTGAADHAPAQESHHIPPQYGIGPFSLREVSLLGVWALAFLFSFFPLYADGQFARAFGGETVWTSGIDWVLSIGAPTAAVFLIVLRRFSPDGIRRVGSLGIDQFASVVFSVSAVVWLGWLWNNIARGAATGVWVNSWVVWAEVLLMAAAVALTVLAPFIPPFHEDFLHRPDAEAHRVARRARPVVARPVSEARYTMAAPSVDPEPAPFTEPEVEEEPAAAQAPSHQAFWALAPVERDVVDENGIPLFRIGPTAWALVIEDRGDSFVVRHEDGRIGYLNDVSGVTRG